MFAALWAAPESCAEECARLAPLRSAGPGTLEKPAIRAPDRSRPPQPASGTPPLVRFHHGTPATRAPVGRNVAVVEAASARGPVRLCRPSGPWPALPSEIQLRTRTLEGVRTVGACVKGSAGLDASMPGSGRPELPCRQGVLGRARAGTPQDRPGRGRRPDAGYVRRRTGGEAEDVREPTPNT